MWDIFKPKDAVWYCWRLNGAAAYLQKNGEMWRIAFKTIPLFEKTGDFGGPDIEDPPESLQVTCLCGDGEEVFPHPYLSDRPYKLGFREKIRIAPGQKLGFTAALPPVLKFELAPDAVLAQAMPLVPRQTFIGPDTMDGKFGYFLGGNLLSGWNEESGENGETEIHSTLIRCDILIKNNAKTTIEPEHFVVYPETLNVYVRQGHLVADSQELEITGTEQKLKISRIENAGLRLVSAGTKSGVGEFIVSKNVDIIKDITKGIL